MVYTRAKKERIMLLKRTLSILLLFASFWVQANEVFDKENQISSGLFSIYKINDAYYFEIPRRLFHRDFLLSVRVAELSSPNNKAKLVAGQRMYDPLLVRFAEEENRLLLLCPNNQDICIEDDPFYKSFAKNNITPIEQTFNIEHKTDSSVFINITKFFKDQLPQVEPFNEKTKPGKIMPELTDILSMQSYPLNVEVKVRNAYQTNKDPFLVILQKSLMMLPEKTMCPRISDKRMGYYSLKKRLYSSKNTGVKSIEYITRFNLQPKEKDTESFLRGKLVEPDKPIIIYVDKDFPEIWRQAIKQGIEDWQPAFEAIGYKNAIIAKDYPKDPEFDPNDIRYSCFRFSVSDNPNAMGVRTVDPRSGEIVQADVLFFSSVVELLQKWYFLQTAAVNEKARKRVLDDEELKKLIRYSAAHEIGHCLGLTHNFRASYAYDTELLRDPEFTKKYGTTPSIMDYARFNYVAQPEDKNVSFLPPHLGLYDKFAIKVGYQNIPKTNNPEDETEVINKWFAEKGKDPIYIFGAITRGAIMTDPSKQSADLGNNPALSSRYGIQNLQYILKHLKEWMQNDGEDYSYIKNLYADIFKENFNYINNVIPIIAGVYNFDVVSSDQPVFTIITKKENIQTIDFIINELKNQSSWLNNDYVQSFAGPQTENLIKQQETVLDKLLHVELFRHMYQYSVNKDMIQPEEYLPYLTSAIFQGNTNDIYINNLRQRYIEKLEALSKDVKTTQGLFGYNLVTIINEQLKNIRYLGKQDDRIVYNK